MRWADLWAPDLGEDPHRLRQGKSATCWAQPMRPDLMHLSDLIYETDWPNQLPSSKLLPPLSGLIWSCPNHHLPHARAEGLALLF